MLKSIALRTFSRLRIYHESAPSTVSRHCSTAASSLAALRNIGIIAHIDAGKTTTTERMLYLSGYIAQTGDVDNGNTVMDYLPAERERGITIQSAAITFGWKNSQLNLIDTPGHADFTFEVERSLRVLDGAITILDGVAGVEAQTEKVWKQADKQKLPRIVFINKMDRVGAEFSRTIRQIALKLQIRPAVLQLPIICGTNNESFVGVVDVVSMQCLVWAKGSSGKHVQSTPVQDYGNEALLHEAIAARTGLVELLSELDEDIVSAFLERENALAIPSNILRQSIRKQCLVGLVVPVLAGASFKTIGVQPLLDAIVDYLPSPDDRASLINPSNQKSGNMTRSVNTCALAFKVIVDPQRGPMVFVRVYAGQISKGSSLLNRTTNKKERALKILLMYADEHREVDSVSQGNIAVILGLKSTRTGDTLTDTHGNREGLLLPPIDVPSPVFTATLETFSESESRLLQVALDDLLREDPSLRTSYNEDTGQTLLSGMGELHLEIALNRLNAGLRTKVEMGELRISYREGITASTSLTDTIECLIGSKSVLTDVAISLAPLSDAVDASTLQEGNLIEIDVPLETHPSFTMQEAKLALRNGISAAFTRGPRMGFPLHGILVKLLLPRYALNSSLASLSSAARLISIRALAVLAVDNSVILEPVMSVTISVKQPELGLVMNDLTGSRGGQVLSLEETSEELKTPFEFYCPPDTSTDRHNEDYATRQAHTIHALVPLKAMIGYSGVLRSLTGGRGAFFMSVHSFEALSHRSMQQLQLET